MVTPVRGFSFGCGAVRGSPSAFVLVRGVRCAGSTSPLCLCAGSPSVFWLHLSGFCVLLGGGFRAEWCFVLWAVFLLCRDAVSLCLRFTAGLVILHLRSICICLGLWSSALRWCGVSCLWRCALHFVAWCSGSWGLAGSLGSCVSVGVLGFAGGVCSQLASDGSPVAGVCRPTVEVCIFGGQLAVSWRPE